MLPVIYLPHENCVTCPGIADLRWQPPFGPTPILSKALFQARLRWVTALRNPRPAKGGSRFGKRNTPAPPPFAEYCGLVRMKQRGVMHGERFLAPPGDKAVHHVRPPETGGILTSRFWIVIQIGVQVEHPIIAAKGFGKRDAEHKAISARVPDEDPLRPRSGGTAAADIDRNLLQVLGEICRNAQKLNLSGRAGVCHHRAVVFGCFGQLSSGHSAPQSAASGTRLGSRRRLAGSAVLDRDGRSVAACSSVPRVRGRLAC